MKPKTKLQVEVWDLHQRRLSNPKEHEPYLQSKHDFYYTNHYKNLVCLECNHSWRPTQIWHEEVVGVVCPSCNNKLKKIKTENGGASRFFTYAIAQVVDRFQVVRYFSCWKSMSKNSPPKYFFNRLFEEWKDWDKNKRVIIGRTQSWSGDGWSNADYEIRGIPSTTSWQRNPYDDFMVDFNCPKAELLPRFKMYGLTKYNHDCDFRMLINRIESSPKIETLLKARQKRLLVYALYKESKHNYYWSQVKLVIRNKYKLTDVGMWYDYLDLLRYFRKDLHNAKYVCPKNLKKEHDRLMEKKREIQRLENQEREKRRVLERQKKLENAIVEYVERTKKFFNLEFKKGNITIKVLQSIDEFKEEGDELKHCVFTNEYYLKKDSLILSAKVDGKRAETIEVKVPDMKIIQSRGLSNKSTEHHDTIVKLVESNLEKIRKIVIENRPRSSQKSAA